MKLELKNIYYSERMSEETPCYQAIVYIDGKKAISVDNHGQGGCDNHGAIHPFTRKDIDKVIDYLAKESGDTFEPLDTWCHNQLFLKEDTKYLRKTMKNNILFFKNKSDNLKGKYYTVKIQNNIGSLIAYIKDKYPQSIILNDMSLEDALKTFRKEVA